MTDIVAFIRARLDEDEQLARHVEHCVGDDYGPLMARIGETLGFTMVSLYNRSHDPARVLREVKVKRAILRQYELAVEAADREKVDDEYGHVLDGVVEALGTAVEQIAAPYDQHPDYDPAWRVDT